MHGVLLLGLVQSSSLREWLNGCFFDSLLSMNSVIFVALEMTSCSLTSILQPW